MVLPLASTVNPCAFNGLKALSWAGLIESWLEEGKPAATLWVVCPSAAARNTLKSLWNETRINQGLCPLESVPFVTPNQLAQQVLRAYPQAFTQALNQWAATHGLEPTTQLAALQVLSEERLQSLLLALLQTPLKPTGVPAFVLKNPALLNQLAQALTTNQTPEAFCSFTTGQGFFKETQQAQAFYQTAHQQITLRGCLSHSLTVFFAIKTLQLLALQNPEAQQALAWQVQGVIQTTPLSAEETLFLTHWAGSIPVCQAQTPAPLTPKTVQALFFETDAEEQAEVASGIAHHLKTHQQEGLKAPIGVIVPSTPQKKLWLEALRHLGFTGAGTQQAIEPALALAQKALASIEAQQKRLAWMQTLANTPNPMLEEALAEQAVENPFATQLLETTLAQALGPEAAFWQWLLQQPTGLKTLLASPFTENLAKNPGQRLSLSGFLKELEQTGLLLRFIQPQTTALTPMQQAQTTLAHLELKLTQWVGHLKQSLKTRQEELPDWLKVLTPQEAQGLVFTTVFLTSWASLPSSKAFSAPSSPNSTEEAPTNDPEALASHLHPLNTGPLWVSYAKKANASKPSVVSPLPLVSQAKPFTPTPALEPDNSPLLDPPTSFSTSLWNTLSQKEQAGNELKPSDVLASPVFSPSSVETYVKCPRQYYFSRRLRLKTKPIKAALAGKVVHAVLEWFNVEATPKTHHLQALLEKTRLYFNLGQHRHTPLPEAMMQTETYEGLKALPKLERDDLEQATVAALEDLERQGYFNQPIEAVLPELKLERVELLPWPGKRWTMVADAILLHPNHTATLLDYKTYRSRLQAQQKTEEPKLLKVLAPLPAEARHHAERFDKTISKERFYQLPLYQLAFSQWLGQNQPGKQLTTVALQLVRAPKGGKPGSVRLNFDLETFEKALPVWAEELNTHVLEPMTEAANLEASPDVKQCGECDFNDLCDAWQVLEEDPEAASN